MTKKIVFLLLIMPSILFANENESKINSVTLSSTPNLESTFVLIEYQRLFLSNHIGLSGGTGFLDNSRNSGSGPKSVLFPVNITYIPFDFIIKPDIFFGSVFSYNLKEDSDDEEWKPIFDKGADACFNFGVGLTVSPIFESVSLGVRLRMFSDNFDEISHYGIFISAGYLF